MAPEPLRLLIRGYGLALAVAVTLHFGGAGPIVAALTAWLGGALAVLALGALETPRRAAAAGMSRRDWLARERELAAWDRDLAADVAGKRPSRVMRRARGGSGRA